VSAKEKSSELERLGKKKIKRLLERIENTGKVRCKQVKGNKDKESTQKKKGKGKQIREGKGLQKLRKLRRRVVRYQRFVVHKLGGEKT